MEIVYVLPDYFKQTRSPACRLDKQATDRDPGGTVLPCPAAAQIPAPAASNVREHAVAASGRLAERSTGSAAPTGCRALPRLPAQGDRLRRVPLPGLPAHRGRGRHRPGLPPLAAARSVTRLVNQREPADAVKPGAWVPRPSR